MNRLEDRRRFLFLARAKLWSRECGNVTVILKFNSGKLKISLPLGARKVGRRIVVHSWIIKLVWLVAAGQVIFGCGRIGMGIDDVQTD